MPVATVPVLPRDGVMLEQLPVDLLQQRCREETKHFTNRQPYADCFCRELMRRALVTNDESAWRVIYHQYQRQVWKWVKAHLAFALPDSELQTLVDDAFLKMQGTFTRHPHKFADYPTLAALLGLLRLCAERVVQDYVAKAQSEVVTVALDDFVAIQEAHAVDDHATLGGGWRTRSSASATGVTPFAPAIDGHELWATLQGLLYDEKEQLVVSALLIEELKPRHLYAEYPTLFQSVDEINTIRERIKARLQRNHEFRQYLQSLSEIDR